MTHDVDEQLARARSGNRIARSSLLTLASDGSAEQQRDLWQRVHADASGAAVIGVTGSPGVGKSTLVDALIEQYRTQGLEVGVLAVDPSSPWSGGALLGDRVRMQRHAGDEGVYVRSLATRGHLGGLASAVPLSIDVLAATGSDVIIVETVGVGQSEVEIASAADTTVVVLAPGFGDGVQAAKAGVLEVADILVVNKDDQPGSGQLAAQLSAAVGMSEHDETSWLPPIVRVVAVRGELAGLTDEIAAHRAWRSTAAGQSRSLKSARSALMQRTSELILSQVVQAAESDARMLADDLARRILERETDPLSAASSLAASVLQRPD